MHWATAFLDVRYARGAEGPQDYDCWSFFRWVQRERFGRRLAAYATPISLGSIAKAMPAWAAEFGWQATDAPRDGDAVFLSVLRHPTHIGVWVADLGRVLHCPEGGAALHDHFHLTAAGWRLRGYFTPVT